MSALTIDPAHSDEPPAELRERARDTGASLAYTAEAGWHLIPSPALLRLIEKTPRRKTPPPEAQAASSRRAVPPPLPPLPRLVDLAVWVDAVNAQLRDEQGYPPRKAP